MGRDQYTPEQRSAWQNVRIAAERLRGEHSKGINKLPKAPNPFGREGSIAKAANEPIAATVKAKQSELDHLIARKAPKGSTINGSGYDSTCFESISWKAYPDGDGTDGEVTATFWRGGDVVYTYDLDRDSFIDWCESSWGGYFNAAIR